MAKKSPGFNSAAVVALLRTRGMRITRRRLNILEALFSAAAPLSLTEIQENAAKLGDAPDFATVFRMMATLEKLHVVQKVNMQRSQSYYELRDPTRHYDHLICSGCGKVLVIDLPCPLHDHEDRIRKRYGFSNITHSLEFFGKCPECAATQKE